MEIGPDRIVLEKPTNALDELLLEVVSALERHEIEYAVVSGYVAVLFGRARATEDIDVLVEPFEEPTGSRLADDLTAAGF